MPGVRKPSVSGSFYPSDKAELAGFIDVVMERAVIREGVGRAHAYVAPHAGYVYSGMTAAFAFKAMSMSKEIEKIDTIAVVGPNHTGYGMPISVSMSDWATPMGTSRNDTALSKEIAAQSGGISIDEAAHVYEHSIEVQLPFLQRLFPEKRLCMICMGDQSMDAAELLASAIAEAAGKLKRNITVVASSDFNHYESRAVAQRKDRPLFELLKRMDLQGFYRKKEDQNESSCGYGPIATALLFSKANGAKKGVLLDNTDSGNTTGDYNSVVDYASLAFL